MAVTGARAWQGSLDHAARVRCPVASLLYSRIRANGRERRSGGARLWFRIEGLVLCLFEEANPMPIEYWLSRQGLIESPECRLPLTHVSRGLRDALDREMANWS